MGLNCMSPLILGFFSIVNATVLHEPQLWILRWIGTEDTEEPQTWKAN